MRARKQQTMVAIMITCPYNYEGPSYPVAALKYDLSEFFADHPNDGYTAYEDHQHGNFVCEMTPELELIFMLKYPKYQRYQRG